MRRWMGVPVALMLTACVTINVYFPAAEAKEAAKEFVEKVIGDEAQPKEPVKENKPGGQNTIGAQAAARAPADGNTLYFATTAALVTNAYLFKSLPYDPQKDFVPVAFIARSPFGLLVEANSPLQSLQNFVDKSKAERGRLVILFACAASLDSLHDCDSAALAKIDAAAVKSFDDIV